jgi:HAD superfamily hydrolase (TIGR01549 family)
MIKAIIFDFDGVIGDTYDLHFNLSKEFYEETEQDFNGNVYEEAKIKFKPGDFPVFFKKVKERFTKDHLFPLKKVFEELNEKYKLFIISSSDEDNIKHFLGLGDYDIFFKKVLGGKTHNSKIEKFKMLFNEYNLKPGQCLFVTDTIGDIKEARKVDVESIAVPWGYHETEILATEKPLAIVHDEKELLDKIREYS